MDIEQSWREMISEGMQRALDSLKAQLECELHFQALEILASVHIFKGSFKGPLGIPITVQVHWFCGKKTKHGFLACVEITSGEHQRELRYTEETGWLHRRSYDT